MNRNPFDESTGLANYGSTSGRNGSDLSGAQGLDEQFKRMREEIANACVEVKRQTNDLRQLLKKIGTSKDNYDLRQRIHTLRHAAFALVTEQSQKLSQITNSYRGPQYDIALRSIQNQFKQIADDFSHVYEQIVGRLQEYPCPPQSRESRDLESRDSRAYLSSTEVNVSGDQARLTKADHLQYQQEVQDSESSYVEQRALDMNELQRDMQELAGIMNAMQDMVVTQGETVDQIEAHVEVAATQVQQGNQQLGAAVRYKRCSRKLTVIIVIVCVCIVIGLVVAITIGVCVGVSGACGKK